MISIGYRGPTPFLSFLALSELNFVDGRELTTVQVLRGHAKKNASVARIVSVPQ